MKSLYEQRVSRRRFLSGLAGLGFGLVGLRGLASAAAKFDSRFELMVEVEINSIMERRVHRPYVAVWIEDAKGNAVRTLALWVQNSGRGPRWIPDLRRWFGEEEARKQAKGGDLVQSISSATRNAGKYQLVFNGKDDAGQTISQGDYYLCIEAAREHGTYQLIREKLSFGTKLYKKDIEGNIEIKGAKVEFRKRT